MHEYACIKSADFSTVSTGFPQGFAQISGPNFVDLKRDFRGYPQPLFDPPRKQFSTGFPQVFDRTPVRVTISSLFDPARSLILKGFYGTLCGISTDHFMHDRTPVRSRFMHALNGGYPQPSEGLDEAHAHTPSPHLRIRFCEKKNRKT